VHIVGKNVLCFACNTF
jgi:hypothetical protein